jgi:hypothetical protein
MWVHIDAHYAKSVKKRRRRGRDVETKKCDCRSVRISFSFPFYLTSNDRHKKKTENTHDDKKKDEEEEGRRSMRDDDEQYK